MFDPLSRSEGGVFEVHEDFNTLQSKSNFSSIRANVGFYTGKWYYELELDTKGVMQLGWAIGTNNRFTPETGVGDTIESYGYDGNRMRKWNMATYEYGEPWLSGDIIGCAIDLDIGSIYFYRNGRSMGEAFSKIQLGPGSVYFPAVSLALNEAVEANFGKTPFKYPVTGFEAPQLPPANNVMRASLIFDWFHKLLQFSEEKPYKIGDVIRTELNTVSEEASILTFARLLMNHLSLLLDNLYIIEACLIPFLNRLSSGSNYKMQIFSEFLTMFLQDEELNFLMKALTKNLNSKFRQVSTDLNYTNQKDVLNLLSSLCCNATIRNFLLRKRYFAILKLPELMDTKPIDELALKIEIPITYWGSLENSNETDTEGEQRKQSYFNSCKKIHKSIKDLEFLQTDILLTLMDNVEDRITKSSSRKYFLKMFRYFLRDNMLASSYQVIQPTPLPVMLNCFHRLLSVLRILWDREICQETPHVPVSKFYDKTIEYFGIDRFGGAWTHLVKQFREDLVQKLGEDHSLFGTTDEAVQTEPASGRTVVRSIAVPQVNIEPSAQPVINTMVTAFRIIGLSITGSSRLDGFTLLHRDYTPASPGRIQSSDSLIELMDGLLLLYHLAGHKQLKNISGVRENLERYVKAFNETQVKLQEAKVRYPSAISGLENSLKIFETKIEDLSRYMAWIRSVIYTPTKKSDLIWLLQAVLTTLKKASVNGNYFTFVPDFYIESMVGIYTALRFYFDASIPSLEHEAQAEFIQVAEFLAVHFSDSRIVNPSVKDTIIQTLAGFLTNASTLKCLENIRHTCQLKMVRDLLQPYDNRPWGQTNWILLRMWQGCGFAFRYQKSPHYDNRLGPKFFLYDNSLLIQQTFEPCPSISFQNLIAKTLLSDEAVSSAFINSVLNQLNWSFSEVIGMLQEIQNFSSRPERVFIESHQLKVCATCFDFALGLLRVLEMIVNICKPVFTDFSRLNAENLLERLAQLLSQILLRVSSGTGCFSHVVSLAIPDLEAIDPFPILAAVVGILVALMQGDESLTAESKNELSPVVKVLLSEPAFQIKCLQYVLEEDLTKGKEKFSLLQYPNAVSESEISRVREVIDILLKSMPKMVAGTMETPDEELCLICCAVPMSVVFLPCLHKSCKSCISHFLLMNTMKNCFFCKAAITSVTDFSGTVVYVVSTEESPL